MTTIDSRQSKFLKLYLAGFDLFATKLVINHKVVKIIDWDWDSFKFVFQDKSVSRSFNFRTIEIGNLKVKVNKNNIVINKKQILKYLNSEQFKKDYKIYIDQMIIKDIIE